MREAQTLQQVPFAPSAEQQRVIAHRGGHLQVIACAGAGKTEAIARRIAALLAEGEEPRRIIAFTFTEKAAASLKDRVVSRVSDTVGPQCVARLGPLFIGTIHAYCWRLLQDHNPVYGMFELLPEHRQAAWLSRHHDRLGLARLAPKHWQAVREFMRHADVVENELIPTESLLNTPFGDAYREYELLLKQYRLMTFGTLIVHAVHSLRQPDVKARVYADLKYLIVDEYQDINAAQDRLIALLAQPPVHLCVVADDDQSIYQWRGADVSNMLEFTQRYRGASALQLSVNRRSRPGIIAVANDFAGSIAPRLAKSMQPSRPKGGSELFSWNAATAAAEAEVIAASVAELRQRGYRYSDVAVLFRSVKGSSGPLLHALREWRLPYDCGGLNGLFRQPEALALAKIYAWLANSSWRTTRGKSGQCLDLSQLVRALGLVFPSPDANLDEHLDSWHAAVHNEATKLRLVPEFYQLLHKLGVHRSSSNTPAGAQLLGACAQFAAVLTDFAQMWHRGRYVQVESGRYFRAGVSSAPAAYRQLFFFLQHYAFDAYETCTGEDTPDRDAVQVLTVHQAKGLEWPIVFLPSLVHGLFPSRFAGRRSQWWLPETAFPPLARARYEGSEAEERRLFYVAMTRAKDALYLSHYLLAKKPVAASTFYREVASGSVMSGGDLPLPEPAPEAKPVPEVPVLSFSALALYAQCPMRYRLSTAWGFPAPLSEGLGYGRAVHHVLRILGETAKVEGRIPDAQAVAAATEAGFYLPFASRRMAARLAAKASAQIASYVAAFSADFLCIWATERSFALRFKQAVIKGRADLILQPAPGSFSIVDFKTSRRKTDDAALQLAVYSAAGRAEGLNIISAYVHTLSDGARQPVAICEEAQALALTRAAALIAGIVAREFPARPAPATCRACAQRLLCNYAL